METNQPHIDAASAHQLRKRRPRKDKLTAILSPTHSLILQGEDLDLDKSIELVETLAKHLRRGKADGLRLSTIMTVLADRNGEESCD